MSAPLVPAIGPMTALSGRHAARSNSARRRFAESFSNPLENAACTLYPARRNSGLVASVATSWVQSTANVAASNSRIRGALETERQAETLARCRVRDKPALPDVLIGAVFGDSEFARFATDARATIRKNARSRIPAASGSKCHRDRRPDDKPRPRWQASNRRRF